MDSSKQQQDIVLFRQAIEEAPTAENGWELVSDEAVSKKFSGTQISFS